MNLLVADDQGRLLVVEVVRILGHRNKIEGIEDTVLALDVAVLVKIRLRSAVRVFKPNFGCKLYRHRTHKRCTVYCR